MSSLSSQQIATGHHVIKVRQIVTALYCEKNNAHWLTRESVFNCTDSFFYTSHPQHLTSEKVNTAKASPLGSRNSVWQSWYCDNPLY